MADLTPKPGGLVWLEPHELALVNALRRDPDQERHIADCRLRSPSDWPAYEVVVRHPVSERLLADALFQCPVLGFAGAWLDDEDDPVGRWRLTESGDALERIES